MKTATLCFLTDNDKILLAMKKRGFGIGRWNGSGGKVQATEQIDEAAVRELREEVKVEVDKNDLNLNARLVFYFPNSDWDMDVFVFTVSKFSGKPRETEEMRPQWFLVSQLPFDLMWPDDILWLNRMLSGEKLMGKFWFAADQKTIIRYELKSVSIVDTSA